MNIILFFFFFVDFLNKGHRNIKSMIEKQISHSIVFLDVFIRVISNRNITLQTYQKSTLTVLLLNFKRFTSVSYESSLIKCLISGLKFVAIKTLFIMT